MSSPTRYESMIICLATYQNRLAAIFDNASELRLYKSENYKIYPAGQLALPYRDLLGKVSVINSCGVRILICGAIRGCTRRILNNTGVQVVPWIKGEIDEVLKAWVNNDLSRMTMPGCQGYGRCNERRTFQQGEKNENSH